MTDKYLKYDEKIEVAKEEGVKAYKFLNDKVYNPIKDNFFVIYDQSTNYITFMINLISEKYSSNKT